MQLDGRIPLDPSSRRAALTNGNCDEVYDIQGPRGPKMSDSSRLSPTLVPTRGPGHKAAFESFGIMARAIKRPSKSFGIMPGP